MGWSSGGNIADQKSKRMIRFCDREDGCGERPLAFRKAGQLGPRALLRRVRREKFRRIFRGAERFAFHLFLGGFLFVVAGNADRRRDAFAGNGKKRGGREQEGEKFHGINRE